MKEDCYVSLTNACNTIKDMSNNTEPDFYTLEELFHHFPTLGDRGWSEKDVEMWVQQDIIAGYQSEKQKKLMIGRESMKAFIAYHDQFLSDRIKTINSRLPE